MSPHRSERPWQGQEEAVPTPQRPTLDPDCYLCPGNERAALLDVEDTTEVPAGTGS